MLVPVLKSFMYWAGYCVDVIEALYSAWLTFLE